MASKGVSGDWRSDRACDKCPRGLFATKPFAAGDVVGRTNIQTCVDLGHIEHDYHIRLLDRVFLEPGFNATYGEYMAVMPIPGSMPCMFALTEKYAHMLQAKAYEPLLQDWETYAVQIAELFTQKAHEVGAFEWTADADLVRYYLSLVNTRTFSFVNQDPEDKLSAFMCPIIDLLNHAFPGNVQTRENEDSTVDIVATQDIKEGEELLFNYNKLTMERPDMQLLTYGFVEDTPHPALSHIDEPTFNLDNTFNPPPVTDLDSLSQSEAAAELARVQSILAGLPTSLEQDQALLEGGEYEGDLTAQAVVKWRVQRKRALLQRVEKLQKQLGEL